MESDVVDSLSISFSNSCMDVRDQNFGQRTAFSEELSRLVKPT